MKNKLNILLLAIFSLTTIGLNGQTKNIIIDDTYQCSSTLDSIGGLQIYHIVEKMPEYPGGEQELIKFISNNIKLPELVKYEDIQTKVYLTFVIDTLGNVTNICLLNRQYSNAFSTLEKEAMRVLTLLPKWTAGEQDGKKVLVQINLPIRIELKY